MQANQKNIVIIAAVALIAGFFMPWISFFVKLSAWDFIFGNASDIDSSSIRFLVVLIPISAIMIIAGASNNENYLISKRLLFSIPLGSLAIVIISLFFTANEDGEKVSMSDFGDILQLLGAGFWITLIASVVLVFLRPQTQATPGNVPVQSTPVTGYSRMSKTGMVIAVLGVVLMFISTQNKFFSKTKRYRVDPTSYGLPSAYDPLGPMYDSRTVVDWKKKKRMLGAGIAALVIGGVVFAAGRSSKSAGGVVTPTDAGPAPTPALNQRPQININLPKVNWTDVMAKTKAFLVKYRVILLSVAGLLIALIVAYNLFLKADPVKDGKRLAKNYCNCSDELNKSRVASMNSYYDQFDQNKFKTRAEARSPLATIMQETQTKYETCLQTANIKFNERLADYQSKGGKNLYTFQQTYGTITSVCNNPASSEVIAVRSKIDEKIRTIMDPEPDMEKIKRDLIGQPIVGWKFQYLNEFRTAQILNTSRANDRIDYQVKMTIAGNTATDEHDCELMVTYVQGDYGWTLSNIHTNSITYVNIFYPDRYIQITPFPNCKWSAENNFKMGWKTANWDYAEETITGPDKGPTTLPYSTTYFIRSLESREIQVKFTYWPAN